MILRSSLAVLGLVASASCDRQRDSSLEIKPSPHWMAGNKESRLQEPILAELFYSGKPPLDSVSLNLEGFSLTKRDYNGTPIVVATRSDSTAYGHNFEVYIYYGREFDLGDLGKHAVWRRCFQFAGGSYHDLRLDFDEQDNLLQIYGTEEPEGKPLLLLERKDFEGSFLGSYPRAAFNLDADELGEQAVPPKSDRAGG